MKLGPTMSLLLAVLGGAIQPSGVRAHGSARSSSALSRAHSRHLLPSLRRTWRPPTTMALDGSDDDVDMELLSRRILGLEVSSLLDQVRFYDPAEKSDTYQPPPAVYVLVFNEGSNNEGVYSIRLKRTEGKPDKNVVLAWQLERDAQQYGQLILDKNMPEATSVCMHINDVSSFCEKADVLLGIIREGCWVDPPAQTVEKFDWAPDGGTGGEAPSREADGSISGEQLEQMRLQLERLSRLSSGGPPLPGPGPEAEEAD